MFDVHIYNECVAEHSHPYAQIMIPLSKDMDIIIGDESFHVKKRRLCYVPPETVHRIAYYGQITAINLTDEVLGAEHQELLSWPVIAPMEEQTELLIELIRTEQKKNPDGKAVYHLYNFLYYKLVESCSFASLHYLNEHFSEQLSVQCLAEVEGFNESYYYDWFKRKTGFTPSLYLRNVRIRRACGLLRTSRDSILQIAVAVGYSSNAAFTRAFRRVTGTSPQEYRRKKP